MTVKCSGAEWNAFYNDAEFWPPNAWFDDAELTINGVLDDGMGSIDHVHASDVIKITGGVFFLNDRSTDGVSLETHFKRWKKCQSTTIFVVEIPKEQDGAFRAFIKQFNGKIK